MPKPTFSRLQLELFSLGELDAPSQAALLTAMTADPELAAHVAEVQAKVAAASELPALPDLEINALTPPQAANDTHGFRRLRWTRVALMAAAALLVAVALPMLFPDAASLDGSSQYRGNFELSVIQERLGETWSVGALVNARTGDHLQFTVTTAEDAWLMVYDVEDSGAVSTFHAPERVLAGRSTELAFQLDDYSGSERIFVLVAPDPIHEERVAEEVNHEHQTPIAELDTFPHLPAAQRSILVHREQP